MVSQHCCGGRELEKTSQQGTTSFSVFCPYLLPLNWALTNSLYEYTANTLHNIMRCEHFDALGQLIFESIFLLISTVVSKVSKTQSLFAVVVCVILQLYLF